MREVKPCPFCGGEATIYYDIDDPAGYNVTCMRCRMETPHFDYSEKAVDFWNKRTDEAEEPEE